MPKIFKQFTNDSSLAEATDPAVDNIILESMESHSISDSMLNSALLNEGLEFELEPENHYNDFLTEVAIFLSKE